jgi:GNAT superfamily N-acetyltransferase
MTNQTGSAWSLERGKESDLDAVTPLVRAFYLDFGFAWDEGRKSNILRKILRSPPMGCLWVVRNSDQVVGYALVIFFLSLEFDGRVAVLDEFFLEPRHRGKGLGGWVLEQLTTRLAGEGIEVIRLEVDNRHADASSLYARCGFRREPREVWSKRTKDRSHCT